MIKADYTYELKDQQLTIEDLNLGQMSVTNCIEDIVDEICKAHDLNPINLSIVYKDSEGIYDGWNYSKQKFVYLNCLEANRAHNKLKYK